MALGLLSVDLGLGQQICYFNDDLYNTPINVQGSYADLNNLIDTISSYFNDGAMWWILKIPYASDASETLQNVCTTLFPNSFPVSNLDSCVYEGTTFYLNKRNLRDAWYYCDRTNGQQNGTSIIQTSCVDYYNNGWTPVIGFALLQGSDIDFDNQVIKAGAVAHYTDIWVDEYTKTFKINTFSATVTYGNGYDIPFTGYIGDTDPYNNGGTSDTGGGTGNFDGTGDDVNIPGLPSLSAVDTGFITLFNPSAGELRSLANYMWSSGFDLETFKKLFADPMDCILGLSIVPVSVPGGGTATVSIGNISTGVSMTKAATQYVEVDCGTLNVNEYWGAYLDYDPYTKAEIYLPYIGTHPIATDDIMDKSVTVKYHVDILSGACTAFVECDGSVLYEFIGQCSSSIPISGNDWTNVINGVLTVAGAIGSMVATGGASAPIATGMIASTAVNSMKPNVEKSGSMSGTGGMLAIQTPYLILTRPRQALPAQQNRYMGYPSFITRQLSDISGYTEIESVHLENIGATESELNEIENLLKSGVIF